jgi:hypothetical protein
VSASVAVDPRGRLDVLLLRAGELATRRLETRLGQALNVPGLNLWDGDGGLEQFALGVLDQVGIAGRVFTPADVAAFGVNVLLRSGGRRGVCRPRPNFKAPKTARRASGRVA